MARALERSSNELLASFDDARMEDIASAVGVSRTSLYYYFPSKGDVLDYLLRSMLRELLWETHRAAAGSSNPSDRLAAVIRAHLTFLSDHPTASQYLLAHLGRAGLVSDIASHMYEAFAGPTRTLIADGASDDSLQPPVGEELATTALLGAVLLVSCQSLLADGCIDVDGTMATIRPMFWHGIAPPGRE